MTSLSIGIQFIRFGVVGLVNTAIDFGLLNLLVILFNTGGSVELLICNAVAFLAANLNSYFGNRYWTFAGRQKASLVEFSVFLLIAFCGLLLNSLVLWLLTRGGQPSLIQLNLAKVAATSVSMGWNFLGYRILMAR